MCSMSGVYPGGQEEVGGIYMLAMLMSCLCTLIRVVWSSVCLCVCRCVCIRVCLCVS